MIIKWLGWASFLIKIHNKTIYIDPFCGKVEEKADLILISHNHPDHCDLSQLEKMRQKNTVVLAPSKFAPSIKAEGLDVGITKDVGGIKITAVPAYNLTIPNHQKGVDMGFIIEVEEKKIYFAGDTDFIPEMSVLQNIGIALLPVGGTYTMDISSAIEAIKSFRPKIVIPMHYGKMDVMFNGRMTHVELPADTQKLKNEIAKIAEVKILAKGESFEL